MVISGCGHFVVLGMSSGHVEVFNIQSGIHRGEFGSPRGAYVCTHCSILGTFYSV